MHHVARLAPIRCDDDISIGPSPDIEQIEWLARRRGFRALLDLNEEGEPGQPLSPNVEASWAHTFELVHERVSVSLERPEDVDVERFLTTLRAIPKPVYVHSAQAARAGALVAIWFGVARGLDGPRALALARSFGIAHWSDAHADLVRTEVDRRAPRLGRIEPEIRLAASGTA